MLLADNFLQNTLNALTTHIALVDQTGTIIAVNRAWEQFAEDNGLCPSKCGPGTKYQSACENPENPDSDGIHVSHALAEITAGDEQHFYYEYPCHSPVEKRWFSLRITRFDSSGESFVVIAHDNITQRKLAELDIRQTNQELARLTMTDGLTGIPNRRAFDLRIEAEWHRHLRLKSPLTVAMIDIDHFKNYNDHYGHQAGDETLRVVASTLEEALRMPTDFCARYGGEEFVVLLPGAKQSAGKLSMQRVIQEISALDIAHESSPLGKLSVSIGVASLVPNPETPFEQLTTLADKALYAAKETGRNQVKCHSLPPSFPTDMAVGLTLNEVRSPTK